MFAWGKNDEGQLWVGDKENRVVLTLVAGLLKTKPVVQVATGAAHTACLTADGLVFVCSYGADGRLGVGDNADRLVPTLVRGELEGRNVPQVDVGGAHTMCVTEDGSVFAFGLNHRGQLGVGDKKERLLPTLLKGDLENKPILQSWCVLQSRTWCVHHPQRLAARFCPPALLAPALAPLSPRCPQPPAHSNSMWT